MSPGTSVQLDEFTSIKGTKIIHGGISGFGLIINQISPHDSTQKYKIAFTSDTEIFPEYANQFNGVDILVANVLRPDDRTCPRHTSVDQLIPEIKKIHPKALIMTLFGAFMDSDLNQEQNIVNKQVEKIKKALDFKIHVIGAQDNQKIKIAELL
jgi:ribonuclease BN (tRNA processing enzyme)